MPGIEVTGLHFSFGGPPVMRGVDLHVEQGSLITLFGPNGAGKTTLLKILAGLLRPSRGTVVIDGIDATHAPDSLRRLIGMISHQPYLYPQLTARENLEFYARLYGLADPRERSLRMIEQMRLSAVKDVEVGTYSRGMQQRLAVGRALLHSPRVLLLDEPFTGLDQQGREQLSSLLRGLKGKDRTVVMATHDIEEGLSLSDRVAVLARGKIALETGTPGLDVAGFEALYREAIARGQAAVARRDAVSADVSQTPDGGG
jgi:heme exporter protein A